MFIEILGVKQSVDVIKRNFLQPVVGDQFDDEKVKSWKIFSFVWDFVLDDMFNQKEHADGEDSPDDTLVDSNVDDDLEKETNKVQSHFVK